MFSPGSPHRTPQQQKHAKKRSSVLTRTGHLDLFPGRRIAGCPLLLAFPGGGRQGGIKAENEFHRLS